MIEEYDELSRLGGKKTTAVLVSSTPMDPSGMLPGVNMGASNLSTIEHAAGLRHLAQRLNEVYDERARTAKASGEDAGGVGRVVFVNAWDPLVEHMRDSERDPEQPLFRYVLTLRTCNLTWTTDRGRGNRGLTDG